MSFSPIQKVALYLYVRAREEDHQGYLDREQRREEYAERQRVRSERDRERSERARLHRERQEQWEEQLARWDIAAKAKCLLIAKICNMEAMLGTDDLLCRIPALEKEFVGIGGAGQRTDLRLRKEFDGAVKGYEARIYLARHERKMQILEAVQTEISYIHSTRVEEYIVDLSDDLFWVGFSGPYESKEQKILNKLAYELRDPGRRWRPKVTVETREVRSRPAASSSQ